MSDERDTWDDARLDAAFVAFASAAPTASDLTPSTVAAVRDGATPTRWWRRPAPWLGLAGAAAVAVIAVVAVGSWLRPTMPPAGGPADLSTLPVLDVPALVARSAIPRSEEVVVRGWYVEAPVEADCEVVVAPHPLVPDCEEWYRFLTAEPEALGTSRSGSLQPGGAHVIPMLREDAHVEVSLGSDQPIQVLAVGHVDDRRAETCPAADRADCPGRFVIDRLLPADASLDTPLQPWQSGPAPVNTADAAIEALSRVVTSPQVVSIGTISADRLGTIEPVVADAWPMADGPIWVIRAFVDGVPVPRSFVLQDGLLGQGGPIWEITATDMGELTSTEPSASEPPSETSSVLDLPVIDVPAAIEVRDGGTDPTELAVRGWFSPTVPATCPFTQTVVFLEPVCTSRPWIVLTAEPEGLVTVTRNGVGSVTYSNETPTGPSIGLIFRSAERDWAPPLPESGTPVPIELVVLGHFDDDRSTVCPRDQEQACRDRFVVDRVVSADGRQPERDVVQPGSTLTSLDEVEALVTGATGDDPILGVQQIEGPSVRQEEPSVLGHPEIGARDRYWVVPVLQEGVAVRYLVIDGTDAVYRLGVDGPTLVAGTPPPFDVPPASPDPNGTFEVEFGGDPPIIVSIRDMTGRVTGARHATDEELQALPKTDGDALVVRAERIVDGVVVAWSGSACDRALTLDVEAGTTRDASSTPITVLTLAGQNESCTVDPSVQGVVLTTVGDPGELVGFDRRELTSFPGEVAGLTVVDVDEATVRQGAPDDDTEIAVKGWLEVPDVLVDCVTYPDATVLEPGCVSDGDDLSLRDASGRIRLVLPYGGYGIGDGDGPTPVVAIGHFDDRRAVRCPDVRRGACEDSFVVDALWIDGRLQDGHWERGGDMAQGSPQAGRDLVNRTIRGSIAGPSPRVLAVGAVTGEDLPFLEPATTGMPLANEPWVWHVTVLEGDRVRTLLITDDDLLARLEVGGDWTIWEISGETITGTMAIFN